MTVAEHIHLGPQQQRVWQIARLRPEASWQAHCALRWPGPIDTQRLNVALEQLGQRHIQLECTLATSSQTPALLPGNQLRLQDGPQPQQRFQCWLEPGESSTVLHLAAPSVLLDSQALALLAAELERLYSGASLAPPTIQYHHFIAWQQQLLEEPEAADGAAFWRAYASGAALLPTAGRRLPSAERWRVAEPLPAALAAALAAAADPEALWIGSLLLTCWHLSGRQERPGIWRTLANRGEASTADLVGLVARTVPLSVPIYPTDRPAGLIERIQQALDDQIDAVDYFADPPLNQRQIVLEWLAPAAGQAATLLEAFSPIEDGGLFCQIWQADQPQLVLYGDAGWLGQRDGQQFAAQWLHVLATLIAGDDRLLSQLPLIGVAESALLLDTFNATATNWPHSPAIPQAIAAQATRTPDAPAVEWQGKTVSYGELHEQALKLAAVLREQGVVRDDIVGIYLERSADFVLALLGILYAGAAYMPLDPANPASRLQTMLEDVPPRLVLSSRQLAPALPGDVATLTLDEVSGYPDAKLDQPLPVLPQQLAYIIFTSGSTGRPKGVGVDHAALQNRLVWAQQTYPLQAQDHLLQTTALGFDFAVWECLAPLMAGAKLVIPAVNSHLDSAELVSIITTQRISVLHFVPALFQPFVEELAPQGCPSLRLVFSGGEALGAPLAARFMAHSAAQLYNQYGPTEATIDATFKLCAAEDVGGSAVVSIGRPVANTQIYILDADLQPVAIGMVGQIYIAGVGLARGYLGQPARTAERFLPNPFSPAPGARMYATGDLASWSPDGQISYLGRSDDQIKVRGVRVELGEVEAALQLCPEVRQCAVKPHQQGQLTRLVAYVVPRDPEALPSVTALRDYSLSRLPDFMVPAAFMLLPKLPLTANGKVDRQALPNPESARPFIETEYVAPSTPLERVLASLWSDILGISPIGLNDDFFELGGYSLLATQLVSRMRRLLRIELPLISVFEATTIAKLASYMQAHEAIPGQTHKIASAIIKIKQMGAQ